MNSTQNETIRKLESRLAAFERFYAQNTWGGGGKRQKGDAKGGKGRDRTPPPPPQHQGGWGQRGGSGGKGGGSKGGGAKGSPGGGVSKYVEWLPGGEERCREFNSPSGCPNGGPGVQCPNGVHKCSLRLAGNKACGEPHSAMRCTNKHKAAVQ